MRQVVFTWVSSLSFLLQSFASGLDRGERELSRKLDGLPCFCSLFWRRVFFYAQGRRAAGLRNEIEGKVNDDLRQMDGIEQRWMLDHSRASNGMPSVVEFDVMQAVYKLFVRDRTIVDRHSGVSTVVPETNLVYCLCYGISNSPLPSDFVKRFTNPTPHVITGTNTLIFKDDGEILERETGQPVVVLALRGLVITGDHADSSIRYINGGMTIAQMFRFARTGGEWTYDSGFSTQTASLSRWGPSLPR
jgi:hypothetical protein